MFCFCLIWVFSDSLGRGLQSLNPSCTKMSEITTFSAQSCTHRLEFAVIWPFRSIHAPQRALSTPSCTQWSICRIFIPRAPTLLRDKASKSSKSNCDSQPTAVTDHNWLDVVIGPAAVSAISFTEFFSGRSKLVLSVKKRLRITNTNVSVSRARKTVKCKP